MVFPTHTHHKTQPRKYNYYYYLASSINQAFFLEFLTGKTPCLWQTLKATRSN